MKFRLLFTLLTFSVFSVSLQAQVSNQQAGRTNIDDIFGAHKMMGFTFHMENKADLNADLARRISVDQVKPAADGGYDVRAFANKAEFAYFLTKNIPWARYEGTPGNKAYTMATTVAQMSAWDRYPVYSVYQQMMINFASNYPTLCKLDTILGSTVAGRQLLVLKISDNVAAREDEPRFLFKSSMHGDETTGFILMLRLANYLLSNYGTNTRITNLVNNMEIWICPLANPDGTYNLSDNTVGPYSFSNPISTRENGNGVDLNRNYKDPDAGDHPDGNAWQPETVAFMNLAAEQHFNMGGSFHGGAEVMNYPWDTWTTGQNPNADANWWERVCKMYVDTSRLVDATYMSDTYTDGVTEGGDWYVITGGVQDYMNYFQYCRMVTLEVDGSKTTATENLNAAWNRNYRAMLNLLQESLYGLRGIVTDSCTGQPIQARVFVNTYDQANDSSHVYSYPPVGDYHKYLSAGTYSVTYSAPGYASKTITGVTISATSATVRNVQLTPVLPDANFGADVTSTCSGVVQFTDLTAGATNWLWNFGDGNTSTQQHPLHQYATNGTFTVSLTVSNCKGSNTETKTSLVSVNLATVPVVNGASRCGAGSLTLSASGTGTINWYDAPDGNLLSSGSSFTTPVLSTSTNYYAAQDFSTPGAKVGKTDSVGGGALYSGTTYYLKFDCTTACTLNSVLIYAGAAGTRTVQLKSSTGTVLATKDVYLPAGASRAELDFAVPVGTNLRLAAFGTTTNMYRSSGGITFPYNLAGKISITGTNASSIRYYYFYDWEIDRSVCSSASVPVTATIDELATAAFTSTAVSTTATFTNTSSNANDYAWDFGDGQSSTQTSPVHTYASAGTFTVRLIASNDCGSDTVTSVLTISTTGGLADAAEAGSISIYPNPAGSVINLSLHTGIRANGRYELMNIVGDVVQAGSLLFYPERPSISLNVQSLSPGIYFIRLMMGEASVIRKVVIH